MVERPRYQVIHNIRPRGAVDDLDRRRLRGQSYLLDHHAQQLLPFPGAGDLQDLGEVFGDRVIASSILDRVLHRAITVNIRGNSYRLKEKLKAGLVQPTETVT